ncbi:hypothetical protein MHYP_G00259550 [Metynnis hypsauchen]
MAPRGSFSEHFLKYWAKLKFTGLGEPPDRNFVGEMLFKSQWLNVQDIYSFISLPNRREFEICFNNEKVLHVFLELHSANQHVWKDFELFSPVNLDVKTLIVKFWTGRISDYDIEMYLKRFCEILKPVVKPVDNFGLWPHFFTCPKSYANKSKMKPKLTSGGSGNAQPKDTIVQQDHVEKDEESSSGESSDSDTDSSSSEDEDSSETPSEEDDATASQQRGEKELSDSTEQREKDDMHVDGKTSDGTTSDGDKRKWSSPTETEEKLRDTSWLIAVRRLPVRAVVRSSCFVKTTLCPMPDCKEEETLEHFLLDCYRSREVWGKVEVDGKVHLHGTLADSRLWPRQPAASRLCFTGSKRARFIQGERDARSLQVPPRPRRGSPQTRRGALRSFTSPFSTDFHRLSRQTRRVSFGAAAVRRTFKGAL